MDQLPEAGCGRIVLQHRAASLDLIMQARAMRRQWLVAACARRSAQVACLVRELVARAGPERRRRPATSEGVPHFGRPA
jgi:hypothetical protein